MKANVGSLDKIIRIIVGRALIVLAYTGTLGVWAYIGIIPLVTALMGWCPIWSILKINTRKESPAE